MLKRKRRKNQKMFRKKHPTAGSRPGTLVISPESPPPKVRVMQYSSGYLDERDVDGTERLKEILDSEHLAWVDVQGFGDEALIKRVGKIFGLHPLLLEDIVNVPQRPKSEGYDDQLLIIVRMPSAGDTLIDRTDFEQVSIVLGPNYVLTFQERYGDVFDPVRQRIRRGAGRIYQQRSDYLAYALIDTVIDSYFPMLEEVGDELERLEDEVITRAQPQLLHELTRWRNRLTNMRRVMRPHRDAIISLIRGDFPMIGETVQLYLRDTYDHTMQTAEVSEMYREMVSNLMNTYLTSVANRTNEVMRVLTIVSTVFIPLTFIVGVYGMNFSNMPELHSRWGYPLVWILMLGIALGLTAFFYRKGWLTPDEVDLED